jgi:hypothetical protein
LAFFAIFWIAASDHALRPSASSPVDDSFSHNLSQNDISTDSIDTSLIDGSGNAADTPADANYAIPTSSDVVITPEEEARSATKIWFARSHARHNKFPDQHNKDPAFFQHEKHVFILSFAGRPIFSRYGDETMLAAYMGVISAIISNIESMKDAVRVIIAGQWKFVFLFKGPIYLLCVSRSGESVAQLRAQLNYAHSQLLTFLTGSIHSVLERAPNYDLRNLMGGTTNAMLHLISHASVHPAYLWEAINVLRLKAEVRARVGAVLSSCRSKSLGYGAQKVSKGLKYAILLAGTHLVNLVRPKDSALYPSDLLLLINFVTSSSSIRNGEVWTPICLPKFNDKGFLYAYVCYLEGDTCLILITSDSEDFHTMSACKQFVYEALLSSGDLNEISAAAESHFISLADLESDVCVPELRHFVYKSEVNSQLVIPACPPPYNTYARQKALHRRYQSVNAKLVANKRRHVIYFETSANDCVLAWVRSGEFEMYCVFSAFVHKQVCFLCFAAQPLN